MILTMSGLLPGAQYQFQWSANAAASSNIPPPGGPPPPPTTTASAGQSVTLQHTGPSAGDVGRTIGTFTADAPTQIITFTGSDEMNLINGFQLRGTQPTVDSGTGNWLLRLRVAGTCSAASSVPRRAHQAVGRIVLFAVRPRSPHRLR